MGAEEEIRIMPRYNEKRIPYQTQEKLLDMFCDILKNMKKRQDVKDFLKDLLNRQERVMLVRRLLIADMLLRKLSYREITNKLRCGSSTIARVERWLNFGRGGYKLAINHKVK